jgi:maleylacetoacetate isomerase/maleylpyruvate isomerase
VKLYGFWRSLASYRVRVTLALKGLRAEEISIDLLKGQQNSDEYLAVNPQGVVPALVLSLIAAADGHPLIVPRVRNYLEREMKQDETARNRWLAHWTLRALEAIEAHLAKEKETGAFCHGDTPTMADVCLASQVIGAIAYFNCDTSSVPAAMRIYHRCMEIDAFARAHPLKQPH